MQIPKREFQSENTRAKIPKQRIPNESYQAKVPKRKIPSESFQSKLSQRTILNGSSQAKIPKRESQPAGASRLGVSERKIPKDCKRKILIERFQATKSRRKNQLAGAAGWTFLSERSRKIPSERSQANDLKQKSKRKIPPYSKRKFPSERS